MLQKGEHEPTKCIPCALSGEPAYCTLQSGEPCCRGVNQLDTCYRVVSHLMDAVDDSVYLMVNFEWLSSTIRRLTIINKQAIKRHNRNQKDVVMAVANKVEKQVWTVPCTVLHSRPYISSSKPGL